MLAHKYFKFLSKSKNFFDNNAQRNALRKRVKLEDLQHQFHTPNQIQVLSDLKIETENMQIRIKENEIDLHIKAVSFLEKLKTKPDEVTGMRKPSKFEQFSSFFDLFQT